MQFEGGVTFGYARSAKRRWEGWDCVRGGTTVVGVYCICTYKGSRCMFITMLRVWWYKDLIFLTGAL